MVGLLGSDVGCSVVGFRVGLPVIGVLVLGASVVGESVVVVGASVVGESVLLFGASVLNN